MNQRRRLIVNADDFGISPGVNRGIVEAHEHGIVTSASLMTRWPAARDAAAYARSHPRLGVGLHVDLGEWMLRADEWEPLYSVVDMDDARAVKKEIRRQLDMFTTLLGRPPDHLDSHQHVHRDEPVRSILKKLAAELRVPLRHFTPHVSYCGDFYGQDENGKSVPQQVSAEALLTIIQNLNESVTELCCHPAAESDIETMYLRERQKELAALCDPRVRQALETANVTLCSFAQLPKA